MRNVRGRALAVAAALLLAILYLIPTFIAIPDWWGNIFPTSRVRLGLDLQGGLYLTLEVQVDEAVQVYTDQAAEAVRIELARAGFEGASAAPEGLDTVRVTLSEDDDPGTVRDILEETLPPGFEASPSPGGDRTLIALLDAKEADKIRKGAVAQALATLRNRINQYGVTEASIQQRENARIGLQLPGERTDGQIEELIGTTALLEFKEVDDTGVLIRPLLSDLPAGVNVKNDEIKFSDKKKKPLNSPYLVSDDRKKLLRHFEGRLPPTHQILLGEEPGQGEKKSAYRTYLVKSPILMTGEGVVNARMQLAPTTGAPVVVFEFDEESARRFADLTGRMKGKRMAVVVDGFVRSAPLIEQRIPGGRAQISGYMMRDEDAKNLAIMLESGAFRASVKEVARRTVGPTLGRDSVRNGLNATLAGFVVVMAFMVIYYRTSGLFAGLAVLFNLAIVLAALAAFDATLTLPGIAGIALTVGLAVDANVLVFERIREEVRIGKTFRAAVDAGFDRAYRTILDANGTTLLAATILYYYGTGPVRGFAVTLSMGILGTLFTTLVFTRLLFHAALGARRRKSVSI